MRMLFDYYVLDRPPICLDTSNIDLMQDFYSDRSRTKLLELECEFPDDYLIGHAKRVGLAGEETTPETYENSFCRRSAMMWSMKATGSAMRISRCITGWPAILVSVAENAAPLAAFLSVGEDTALGVAGRRICLRVDRDWTIPDHPSTSSPASCAANPRPYGAGNDHALAFEDIHPQAPVHVW